MIRFAAIDLKAGEVVQLVGGHPDELRVRIADPIAVARDWEKAGFEALHVVDLDAALGSGSNSDLIRDIISAVSVPVQVGGGVRDEARIAELLDAGASRVIVGTRAVEDAEWRIRVARQYPDRLILAADTREGVVLTRGWTATTRFRFLDLLDAADQLDWAAVLVTDVSREGRMSGVDPALFSAAVKHSRHPLYAAGGIRDEADLARLAASGVAGAVLGMALYTGGVGASGPESGSDEAQS